LKLFYVNLSVTKVLELSDREMEREGILASWTIQVGWNIHGGVSESKGARTYAINIVGLEERRRLAGEVVGSEPEGLFTEVSHITATPASSVSIGGYVSQIRTSSAY